MKNVEAMRVAAITDNGRASVVRVDLFGVTGEIAGDVLDPATFFRSPPSALSIDKIQYALCGFDVLLDFDYAGAIVPLWVVPKGSGVIDFNWLGGLADQSSTRGRPGKIRLATAGHAAGACGSLILSMTKKS